MRPTGEMRGLADPPPDTQLCITAMLAGDTRLGKVRWRRGRERGRYGNDYHMRASWRGMRVVLEWKADAQTDKAIPHGYLSIGGCDLSDDGRCVADAVIEAALQREAEAEARREAREARSFMRVCRRVFGKATP